MKKSVLFIQGGGQGAYEADGKLAASLRVALGAEYNVVYPRMPNEDAPDYAAWRGQISTSLAAFDGTVILVGHSLGASLLLKYLAEEHVRDTIIGVFLLAPPYWGAEDWEVDEYALPENAASRFPKGLPMFFYHSRDDEWVPFAHFARYAEMFPKAAFQEFDGRGHQFNDDVSEVATDIASLYV